jgi:hypothetical protein
MLKSIVEKPAEVRFRHATFSWDQLPLVNRTTNMR